jgi:hypothetical protein
MKKVKPFDCVRYKDDLQTRLRGEYAGLTDEQVRRRIRQKLATSPGPIAKLWRTLEARDKAKAKPPAAHGVRQTGTRLRRAGNPA